ncbi:exopolysaccharide biosynthesis polyprenyl glycosylphosphotransferase [Paenibacillus algorifonticola]|uniref:Exopolysaccharide biosynthesis polyprenyl glycosylphosphotransferase n=1 Tax=Paenibacillus algorifonticola TaxID=684063 RepID=A0A1I2GIS4_9BACL|nr:sugar transferase [Paenibacillus algorifonticola]SFF16757.1 exopolysaccharide biosynthesis polyprenyl glycosylphosphotransferase [Paenibacillus algorifonticola]
MPPSPQRNDARAVLEGGFNASYEKRKSLRLYLMAKRAVDIIGAATGIMILSPVLILVAVLIKLEDPRGKIFFYQTRVGRNERTFKMYKFRSMVSNAEDMLEDLLSKNEVEGAMFKMKEDPRITKIGRFIRKTSIDELPQFWNVLRGDMSLVGPRPPLPREVESYSSYDKLRLRVTPGCTGLWQVSGRNELNFHEMVELDLQYIKQRSIIFDIKIILLTVKVMFGSKDAY